MYGTVISPVQDEGSIKDGIIMVGVVNGILHLLHFINVVGYKCWNWKYYLPTSIL